MIVSVLFTLRYEIKVSMLIKTLNDKRHIFFCFVSFRDYSANVSHSLFFLCGVELSLISLQVPVLLSFVVGVNTGDYEGHWHTVTDWRLDSGAQRLRGQGKKVHRCISVSLRMYRQIPQSPPSNQNCTRRRDKTREVLSSNCSNPGSKWKGALLHIHLVLF